MIPRGTGDEPVPPVGGVAEPGDLVLDVLTDAGFVVLEEDRADGKIVARRLELVGTGDEQGEAVAELRRVARFDEELGSDPIVEYEIRVEVCWKAASSDLHVAAKAEIWATPRSRVTFDAPPEPRRLVSRGVLERELIDLVHMRWSE